MWQKLIDWAKYLLQHKSRKVYLSAGIVLGCGIVWLQCHPEASGPRPPLLCKIMGEPGGIVVTWQAPDQMSRLLFPRAPGQEFAVSPDAFCFWQSKLVWWANGANLRPTDASTPGLLGLLGESGPVRWVAPDPPLPPNLIVLEMSLSPAASLRPDVVRLICGTFQDSRHFGFEIAPSTGRWRRLSAAEQQRERERQGYLEPVGDTSLRVHPPNGGPTRLINDCSHPELAVYDPARDAVAYNTTYSTPNHEGQIAYHAPGHAWTRPGPGAFDHFSLTIHPQSGEVWTAYGIQSPEHGGLTIYAPDGHSRGWRTRERFPTAPYFELTSLQVVIVKRLSQESTRTE